MPRTRSGSCAASWTTSLSGRRSRSAWSTARKAWYASRRSTAPICCRIDSSHSLVFWTERSRVSTRVVCIVNSWAASSGRGRAEPFSQRWPGQRVPHVGALEPAATRLLDAQAQELQLLDRTRGRGDHDPDTRLLRRAAPGVVEIEPQRLGIDLQRDAVPSCRLDHGREIDRG